MFGGSTDEYESLEARNRIKAAKKEKDEIKDLIHKIICHGATPPVENHVVSFLRDYPEYWTQHTLHDTVYCKWIGVSGFGYYLGIGPEQKCPVCGHKGKHHVHHDKKSWCRICTNEAKEKNKNATDNGQKK